MTHGGLVLSFTHGAAPRHEVAAVLGESRLRVALRTGSLMQPWRGVIVDGGRALEPLTRAAAGMIACGPGGVLSHGTAAALHGCSAAAVSSAVHVTVPYTHWVRSRAGLIVHHGQVRAADVETMHGLQVVVLEHAITDVLCTERRWVALACLDQALAGRSVVDARAFRAAVEERVESRENRRGVRAALGLLVIGSGGADSPQESRLRLLVVDAGFPVPVTQHPIMGVNGVVVYLLDIAWPELRIGLEYDGFAAHEGRDDYDAERDRRLAGHGWRILRVRKHDFAQPQVLLAELRRAFAERGAGMVA